MRHVIPRPPASIQETTIFRRLMMSPDPDGLHAKVARFIDVATPLLDRISAGPFKYYTLHNRDHARKLVHLADNVIDPKTLDQLTPFECLLIVYASYLHDMGLSISEPELRSLIASEEFNAYLSDQRQLVLALDVKRQQLSSSSEQSTAELELDIADIYSVALSSFLRPRHATRDRYIQLIDQLQSGLRGDDPFSLRGISFIEELVDVCVSHNLDAATLAQMRSAHEERFPRHLTIADHTANTQFVAAVLRVTDILDCDFERTPRVLFDSLGIRDRNLPEADVSLREWEKHLAVQQLEVTTDEVVITASCQHPAIEATVRGFAHQIEQEIRETLAILRHNPADIATKYQLQLPATVRCEIRRRGYVFMDLALRLDEGAITGLLMGTRLYPTRYASVRELIQNGIDACAVRRHIAGVEPYRPTIEIFDLTDDEGSLWLAVRDNGVGMTEEVLRSHFFRVGSSYYSSASFERLLRARNLKPIPLIARFGIGFLSVFMLGPAVQVETRRMPMLGVDSVGWRVYVQQHGALAYVQVDNSLKEGTTVRVRLGRRDEQGLQMLDEVVAYLRENVLRPPIEIEVRLSEHRFRIGTEMFAEPLESPVEGEEVRELLSRVHLVRIDCARFTEHFRGRIYLLLARVSDSALLDCRLDDKPMELSADAWRTDRVRVRPKWLLKNFGGNRISVGGFRMIMGRLGKLLRRGDDTVPAVYDLDFVPGPLIDFDVARTKIRDMTMVLRQEVRRVIIESLKAEGAYEALTPRARQAIEGRTARGFWEMELEVLRYKASYVGDEELLEKVQKLLPINEWPVGIHAAIAAKLGISNKIVYNAISTLLLEGRVEKPESSGSTGAEYPRRLPRRWE